MLYVALLSLWLADQYSDLLGRSEVKCDMTQNTWKNHSFFVIRLFVHFSTNKSWSWPWISRACISVNGLLTVDTPTESHQSLFKACPWWRQPQLAACPVAGSLQMSSFPSRSLFTGGVAARQLLVDSQRDPSEKHWSGDTFMSFWAVMRKSPNNNLNKTRLITQGKVG